MQIYLYQNEEQIGPYTQEQIRALLSAGSITGKDICWHEGLSDWQPLNTVIPLAESDIHQAPTQIQSVSKLGEIQTNVKQGALIGGAVCFVIGIVLMCLTMWSFLIYGPLFLVSFVLGIVAMAQRRILGGLLLLLATLIVPTILGLYLLTTRTAEALNQHKQSSEPQAPRVSNQTQSTSVPGASRIPSNASTTHESARSSSAVKATSDRTESGTSKNPALDAKMGFRNYKLGTPIGEFRPDDLQAGKAFVETDMKPYFAKNFDPTLGAAQIEEIQLNFNEDLLESVIVRVKGEQNSVALRETLIAGYGQPSATNSFMTDAIRWEGDDCVLIFNNELMGGANARFSSKSVDDKIKELKQTRAKEGAVSGASKL